MPRKRALRISEPVRDSLVNLWRSTREAEVARRALALLELDSGRPKVQVADRLFIARQTLDNWIARFQADPKLELEDRLRDRPRPGAPDTKRRAALELIGRVIEVDPRELGWDSPNWTARMLASQLGSERPGLGPVSQWTLKQALREAGYAWKRPRYVLSRRDPHWREAKGGSRGA